MEISMKSFRVSQISSFIYEINQRQNEPNNSFNNISVYQYIISLIDRLGVDLEKHFFICYNLKEESETKNLMCTEWIGGLMD